MSRIRVEPHRPFAPLSPLPAQIRPLLPTHRHDFARKRSRGVGADVSAASASPGATTNGSSATHPLFEDAARCYGDRRAALRTAGRAASGQVRRLPPDCRCGATRARGPDAHMSAHAHTHRAAALCAPGIRIFSAFSLKMPCLACRRKTWCPPWFRPAHVAQAARRMARENLRATSPAAPPCRRGCRATASARMEGVQPLSPAGTRKCGVIRCARTTLVDGLHRARGGVPAALRSASPPTARRAMAQQRAVHATLRSTLGFCGGVCTEAPSSRAYLLRLMLPPLRRRLCALADAPLRGACRLRLLRLRAAGVRKAALPAMVGHDRGGVRLAAREQVALERLARCGAAARRLLLGAKLRPGQTRRCAAAPTALPPRLRPRAAGCPWRVLCARR